MTLHFSQMGFTEGFTFIMINLLCGGAAAHELLRTPGNARLRQIVRRHFHRNFVSGQNADKVGPQLAGDVCEHGMTVGLALDIQLFNLKNCVGHRFPHNTFYFDDIFFRQVPCLLKVRQMGLWAS